MITVREMHKLVNDNESQPLAIIKREPTNDLAVVHFVPAASAATVTMVPFAQLATVSPCSKPDIKIPIKSISPPTTGKVDVYQQRKTMLAENRELFTALMKLRDKDLQKKILKVINEHNIVEYRSIQIQTDPVEIKQQRTKDHQQTYIIQKLVTKSANPSPSSTSNESTNIASTTAGGDSSVVTKKRKRKRKVSQPQANKESRVARHTAKLSKPTLPNKQNASSLSSTTPFKNLAKRPRTDSFANSECSTDLTHILADGLLDSEQNMKQKHLNLVKDILLADVEMENGLLPIHDTIINNQPNNLKRQIFIWKDYKKYDLNDLVTDEGENNIPETLIYDIRQKNLMDFKKLEGYDAFLSIEIIVPRLFSGTDLIQLAVLHTCEPSIFEILLENGLNPNCLDEESNTVLHLAILNDVNPLSLEYLVKHIDLKLFTTLNDDGYTPLHLAIRQDRYLLAECLINMLDERLMGKRFYARDIDKFETNDSVMKTQFKEFYEKICLNMEVEEEDTNACVIQNHELKQKLLQCGDRRSGNISLYFAIENKSEHLIYFLLAHLTDPRTENLSGQDCKSFFAEFGKSLNLSLNIDNTMEKVIKLLS